MEAGFVLCKSLYRSLNIKYGFFKETGMKKKGILLAAVVMFGVAGLVQAQEGELHGTIDMTYQSKYVWRGFDVYGDKGAIQPSIDLDLFGTGFGLNVMVHRANSSGYEDFERWDYNLYYHNCIFEEESYATLYRIGWVHYNYPDGAVRDYDLDEIHTIFSWPKICPAGVVPSYCLVKLWPTSSGSKVGSKAMNPMGMRTRGTASGWCTSLCLITAGPYRVCLLMYQSRF